MPPAKTTATNATRKSHQGSVMVGSMGEVRAQRWAAQSAAEMLAAAVANAAAMPWRRQRRVADGRSSNHAISTGTASNYCSNRPVPVLVSVLAPTAVVGAAAAAAAFAPASMTWETFRSIGRGRRFAAVGVVGAGSGAAAAAVAVAGVWGITKGCGVVAVSDGR